PRVHTGRGEDAPIRGQSQRDIRQNELDLTGARCDRGVGLEVLRCAGSTRHREATVASPFMPSYSIRLLGDPVLKQKAAEIDDVDGALVRLAEDMVVTLHEAAGLGLAAPQVGVQKRLFVYDLHEGEGPKTIVNPVVSEHRGEWTYEEGCL